MRRNEQVVGTRNSAYEHGNVGRAFNDVSISLEAVPTQTIKRNTLTLELQQDATQRIKINKTTHKVDGPEEQVHPTQGAKRKHAAAFSRLVGKVCRVSS